MPGPSRAADDDDGDALVRGVAQELDVQETLVIEEKDPQALWTLLSGLPSPTSLLHSSLTFAINLALAAMVADLVYHARFFHPAHDLSFARTGYVSPNSAKILVREPDAGQYPLFISYRYADPPYMGVATGGVAHDSAWKTGGSVDWLDESTDFKGTFSLNRLTPDTRYQWVVSTNHTGFLVTAPVAGRTSERLGTARIYDIPAYVLPEEQLSIQPLLPRAVQHGTPSPHFRIPQLKAQFMLFLSDFIYIDVPRRHASSTREHYRREYRQTYASPDWAPAVAELPWIHTYDDHEVANDWSANTTGLFATANDPYMHYHTSVNPSAARLGETYFSFTQGPSTFSMLETRRYRSPNDNGKSKDDHFHFGDVMLTAL
ncbi:hypothetical protein LTR53_005203 [Teratosphaeriaceae sp. CCFEE 6253]|nr:hypothetical protein LTR53_005203 [Teratosphaeriaceae sp. CCFEE 6253]